MVISKMRPYAGKIDLQPIANLLNLCAVVDCEDSYYSVSSLQIELTQPGFDPVRDLCLWQDLEEQVIAIGQMWIPVESAEAESVDGFLWFRVHPTARDQGLETEILAWGEARMREVSQVRSLPATLYSGCRDQQHDRIKLLENSGFTYERCFLRMARSLAVPIPTPKFPEGFVLTDVASGLDAAGLVELYNQTFIDHWNFHPLTIERLQHRTKDPNYRPELELVAITPNGTYAGFCDCYVDREENQQRQCNEGWISRLGTRRGFRRMGLARALLLSGLQQLKDAGIDTAMLGVDTQNPNHAQSLYEAVGFCTRYADLSYAKQVP